MLACGFEGCALWPLVPDPLDGLRFAARAGVASGSLLLGSMVLLESLHIDYDTVPPDRLMTKVCEQQPTVAGGCAAQGSLKKRVALSVPDRLLKDTVRATHLRLRCSTSPCTKARQ